MKSKPTDQASEIETERERERDSATARARENKIEGRAQNRQALAMKNTPANALHIQKLATGNDNEATTIRMLSFRWLRGLTAVAAVSCSLYGC